MRSKRPHEIEQKAPAPTFGEAFKVWFKIGCLSFGGPAGQIALMHKIVVDEKKWLDEPRFLHALNFSMLLPGPEATELATYAGWLLHGVRGGLVAGILFVVPGALVMLGLSLLYVYGRGFGPVDGALFGIKAAVLVIVAEALIRIGRRSLKSPLLVALAAAGFIGIFFFALPFPLIVVAAALIGFVVAQRAPEQLALSGTAPILAAKREGRWRQFGVSLAIGLILWWAPVALAAVLLGGDHVLVSVGLFFSKLAVVTFGGAYAVLSYMAQQAVETHGLAERAGNGRRPRPRRDHAGPADFGYAIRRLPGGVPGPCAVLAARRRFDRRGHDDLGDFRAADFVDLCRRALHRGIARQ